MTKPTAALHPPWYENRKEWLRAVSQRSLPKNPTLREYLEASLRLVELQKADALNLAPHGSPLTEHQLKDKQEAETLAQQLSDVPDCLRGGGPPQPSNSTAASKARNRRPWPKHLRSITGPKGRSGKTGG